MDWLSSLSPPGWKNILLCPPLPNREARAGASSKQERLHSILKELQRVLVCFSGGIDSTFMLWSALESLGRENVLAATAVSPSLAQREKTQIQDIVNELKANHQWLNTNEFDNPNYLANTSNRCFFCKDELFSQTAALAKQYQMVVVDGFNYSDRQDFRPGYAAASKWSVTHPLEEAGLVKEEIRELAHRVGLPNWDKPATPCLSSRIPHGQRVTSSALSKVEEAEDYLRNLGFKILRVRHLNEETAKIELTEKDLPIALEKNAQILEHFQTLGFKNTYLDLTPRAQAA